MIDPIVAKQTYMIPDLFHRYKRTFIHQFYNFYIGETCMHSAAFAEIFVQL